MEFEVTKIPVDAPVRKLNYTWTCDSTLSLFIKTPRTWFEKLRHRLRMRLFSFEKEVKCTSR